MRKYLGLLHLTKVADNADFSTFRNSFAYVTAYIRNLKLLVPSGQFLVAVQPSYFHAGRGLYR